MKVVLFRHEISNDGERFEMRSNDLSRKIALRLVQDISAGNFVSGDHIGAQLIADRYRVSRTPVRNALDILADRGVLRREQNRGFFVAQDIPEEALSQARSEKDDLSRDYHHLADDWLADRIPDEMTEQALRERYDLTKARLAEILARALREGWAERKEGHGWRFLPVAKTPEAFDQIYRFRIAIEPIAMLEPNFKLDREVLAELRKTQEWLYGLDPEETPNETVLGHGTQFHEALVRMSGNPFFVMSLERVNRMRRLMEYRAQVDKSRLINESGEHLEILDLLETGQVVDASYRLRQHLMDAQRRKSPKAWNWSNDESKARSGRS